MQRSQGHAGFLRRHLPAVGFGLGVLCLMAMVPVTLGALAGAVTLGSVVPVLGVALTIALFSLHVSDR
jgi:hypothetical protein